MKEVLVSVLSNLGEEVSPCSPARARILTRDNEATWITSDPPVIRLRRQISIIGSEHTMGTVEAHQTKAKTITNFTNFFAQEKDVYIQNVSNGQVSLSFEVSPGNTQGFLVPRGRDPFNLTQSIPFQAIRASADFRKMLNRRPAAIALLTEEEYHEYFKKKALNAGHGDVEKAIDEAEMRRTGVQNKTAIIPGPTPSPIHEVVQDGKHFGEQKVVRTGELVGEDETINPRVLHLCQQVSTQIPEAERMKAGVLLEELQSLEGELKMDDYEYIRAHGQYRSIKNWAMKKASSLASENSNDIDDTTTTEG
jgi:hypothetical protein